MELTKELYIKHRKRLLWLAGKILHDSDLAQDAVQDVFIRFHFYPGELYDNGLNLLCQITKTICWDYLRYGRKWDFVDSLREYDRRTSENIEAKLTVKEILKCSQTFTPRLREVFLLHWYREIPKSEIALRTGQKHTTVRWTYAEAVKKLKQKYQKV